MKITDTRRSLETCTESGWDAVDMLMDEPIDDEWIEGLRRIEGSFVYMKTLRKPFFKLEFHNYVIKGVKGDMFFRLAYHRDYQFLKEEIREILNG